MKRASAASDDVEAELDHRILVCPAVPRCLRPPALSPALATANEYPSASLQIYLR